MTKKLKVIPDNVKFKTVRRFLKAMKCDKGIIKSLKVAMICRKYDK